MSGFSVSIEYNDKAMLRELDQVLGQMTDLAPFYNNVGGRIELSTTKRFKDESAPDGTKWQALKPATLANRERKGQGTAILRASASGGLSELTYSAFSDQFAWGSDKPYAAIHQFGGQAGRGKKVTIPARPYLGLSPEDEEEILNIAKDHAGL